MAENSFLESMNGREKKGGKKNKQSEKKGKIGDRTAKGSVLARGIGASAGQGERFSLRGNYIGQFLISGENVCVCFHTNMFAYKNGT